MELADDQGTGGQINPGSYHPRTLKSDRLLRSRLPFEECISGGIALTTALVDLHGNGLVHRDVKPSKEGGSGQPSKQGAGVFSAEF